MLHAVLCLFGNWPLLTKVPQNETCRAWNDDLRISALRRHSRVFRDCVHRKCVWYIDELACCAFQFLYDVIHEYVPPITLKRARSRILSHILFFFHDKLRGYEHNCTRQRNVARVDVTRSQHVHPTSHVLKWHFHERRITCDRNAHASDRSSINES